MKFGRVIGTVVCTHKDENLMAVKLLLIQPLSQNLQNQGDTYVAADSLDQAGVGDIVSVVFSADATQAFGPERIPVDASIVGLLDPHTISSLRCVPVDL